MASEATGNTISIATSERPAARSIAWTLRTIAVTMPDSVPSTTCTCDTHCEPPSNSCITSSPPALQPRQLNKKQLRRCLEQFTYYN